MAWTLSTSPATSISTCISRTKERQIEVNVLTLINRLFRQPHSSVQPSSCPMWGRKGKGTCCRPGWASTASSCSWPTQSPGRPPLQSRYVSLDTETWHDKTCFFKNGMDSSMRALIVAFSTDFYYCLYCPALVLYACPSVRRNFRLLAGFSVTSSSKSRKVFSQLRVSYRSKWVV